PWSQGRPRRACMSMAATLTHLTATLAVATIALALHSTAPARSPTIEAQACRGHEQSHLRHHPLTFASTTGGEDIDSCETTGAAVAGTMGQRALCVPDHDRPAHGPPPSHRDLVRDTGWPCVPALRRT